MYIYSFTLKERFSKVYNGSLCNYSVIVLFLQNLSILLLFRIMNVSVHTLNCLSIGTPKTINFPFVPHGKLMVFM